METDKGKKRCNKCGEEILKIAKKCKHCGSRQPKQFYEIFWFWFLLTIFVLYFISQNYDLEENSDSTLDGNHSPTPILDIKLDECSSKWREYTATRVNIGGTIKNNTDRLKRVYIEAGLYNTNNVLVETTNDIATVPAYETARWKSTIYTDYEFEQCEVVRYSILKN